MKWIDTLFEYIFPPRCAGCHQVGFELCEKCIEHVKNSFPRTQHGMYVGFSYQDPIVKRALKALKFAHRKKNSVILGELLYDKLIEELSEERAYSLHKEILVIPIPLSKKRFNERGFNQSELIARSFASRDTTMRLTTNILKRTTHSKPQSSIHLKRERLENIKGVFEVADHHVLQGKCCIILDDIVTTGATMKEAEKALKNAGAKKILLVACAH